jgi:UDP-2,4-diacetamido-2,4,6-trideoxy-beta-L-altropyranose hydrolase
MTLAHVLQKQGGVIHFLVNQDPLVSNFLRKHGFDGVAIETQADRDLSQTLSHARRRDVQALVVDSYAVKGECFAQVREMAVAVVDDLADRPLPVDLVVNGAANACELSYRTSPRTKLLLGSDYILLREEFSYAPDRSIREHVVRVMITMGGTDPFTLTSRLIAWTRVAMNKVDVGVVVGPFFTEDAVHRIEQLVEGDSFVTLYRDPHNLRDLMLSCDVAIVGGGQTTYELAATGTPAVAIRLADNQTGNLHSLSAKGALEWVGDVHDVDLEGRVIAALQDLAENPDKRMKMSRAGRALVDGGGAGRVAQAVLEICPQ